MLGKLISWKRLCSSSLHSRRRQQPGGINFPAGGRVGVFVPPAITIGIGHVPRCHSLCLLTSLSSPRKPGILSDMSPDTAMGMNTRGPCRTSVRFGAPNSSVWSLTRCRLAVPPMKAETSPSRCNTKRTQPTDSGVCLRSYLSMRSRQTLRGAEKDRILEEFRSERKPSRQPSYPLPPERVAQHHQPRPALQRHV